MYTQAQVYTNHRPKKILIDPIQPTWINPRTPIPILAPHLEHPHPHLPPVTPTLLRVGSVRSSADGVSDIGHFHVLVRKVVTA